MINTVILKDPRDYLDNKGTILEEISSLSKINIFVGKNNAGKSRLLRQLIRDYRTGRRTEDLDAVTVAKIEILIKMKELKQTFESVVDYRIDSGIFNLDTYIASTEKIPEHLGSSIEHVKEFIELHKRFISSQDYAADRTRGSRPDPQSIKDFILNWKRGNTPLIEQLNGIESIFSTVPKSIYIPTLRTLNTFDGLANKTQHPFEREDIYKKRVQEIYKLTGDFIDIFSGMNFYKNMADLLLGYAADRARAIKFQEFLSENIFNAKVEVIPSLQSDVVVIKMDGVEHPIYDFGDGIQGLIIYTFAAFTNPDALIFIDEPETHLHPGIQRKLFKCLQKLPNQFFITTHSNHLLDISLDHGDASSFYLLRNHPKIEKKFIVELLSEGDSLMLAEIGCQKSSVFLANASIWVEGITDRLYIQKFVDEYLRVYKDILLTEDIDYVFFEYGGSNIVHFFDSTSELNEAVSSDRLTSKSIIVFDGDGGRKKKRKAAITDFVGRGRCVDLVEKEIENLLSPEVVDATLRGLEKQVIATMINTIKPAESLGKQIDKHYHLARTYSDKNSLARKLIFCRKAITHIKYETMSEASKQLAKRIVEFVNSERQQFN